MATACHNRAGILCYYSISQAQGRLLMSSRWQLTTQAVQRFHVIKFHTQHQHFSFQPTPVFGMGDTLQRLGIGWGGQQKRMIAMGWCQQVWNWGVCTTTERLMKAFTLKQQLSALQNTCVMEVKSYWALRAACRVRKMFLLPTFACLMYFVIKICWVGIYLITCVESREKDMRHHENNRDTEGFLSDLDFLLGLNVVCHCLGKRLSLNDFWDSDHFCCNKLMFTDTPWLENTLNIAEAVTCLMDSNKLKNKAQKLKWQHLSPVLRGAETLQWD